MLEINFCPFPDIETERLLLRQAGIKDDNEIYQLKSDDAVLKYIKTPKCASIEDARAFINKINLGITSNKWIFWGITAKETDRIMGTICLWNIDTERLKAEVGYDLLPCYQGKGIMNEAMAAVIKYGFNRMQLCLIEAHTNPCNTKSIQLLQRNNFIASGMCHGGASPAGGIPDAIYNLYAK